VTFLHAVARVELATCAAIAQDSSRKYAALRLAARREEVAARNTLVSSRYAERSVSNANWKRTLRTGAKQDARSILHTSPAQGSRAYSGS